MTELKELKKNTLIIAVANFGSKIIAFVLSPLYSFYMSVSDYGTMDLINSTITLIMPIICFDIYEATFRYSSDKDYDKRNVFSTSIVVCIPGILIGILALIIAGIFRFSFWYVFLSTFCVLLTALNSIMAQYLRGTGKMKMFAASGIVSSISLLAAIFFFLINLRGGVIGWLISLLFSKIVEFIYLLICVRFFSTFSLKKVSFRYAKKFLGFALPLMPTTIMWWVMNMSDRYMLTGLIDVSATGIYAVSSRIPSLLSVFENVFYQAWQTTAINTYKDDNKDPIFSRVFNNYIIVMTLGIVGVLIISQPVVIYLFDKDYSMAWIYIPPLLLGVLVHALNGFLGTLYSVFKNTKGALFSTGVGALTNIILNFIFIPIIGIFGASITTLLGYIATFIYRWFDTKKFVNLKLNKFDIYVCMGVLVIQIGLYYFDNIWSYFVRTLIFLIFVYQKRKLMIDLIKR